MVACEVAAEHGDLEQVSSEGLALDARPGPRRVDGIKIIRRRDGQKGFEVLPRRWVVERTFGWMIRWRRLVRDYERRIEVSTAMIHVAMGGVLIRRNAHP